MAASAETGGQLRDGYFRRLGSQGNTDAGIVLRFFQISGQPDSLHGTQEVNQAFRIFRTASNPGFCLIRQAKRANPAVRRQLHSVQRLTHQLHFHPRLFLVKLAVDVLDVNAHPDQIRSQFHDGRRRHLVLERPRIRADGHVKGVSHHRSDGNAQILEKVI